MLTQISIKNFALIDEMTLDFGAGLNALTGETGAGKSILIDALRMALGERMEIEMVRDKSRPCIIEAAFLATDENLRNKEIFQQILEEGDEYVILKREVTLAGRSKNFVNGRVVNLSALRDIACALVDFHGHYDNQRLFEPDSHLEFIDRLAGIVAGPSASLLESYRVIYHQFQKLLRKKESLLAARDGKERQVDLLKYQIEEIESVNPKPDEDLHLTEEKIRLAHAQKLYDLTSEILTALDEKEDSASSLLGSISRCFDDWHRIDDSIEKTKEEMGAVGLNLEEIIRTVQDYRADLSFDEDRLEELESRIDRMEHLKRKYGITIQQVLEFCSEAKEKLDALENSEVYEKDLDKEIDEVLTGLKQNAAALSQKRVKRAADLGKVVEGELRELNIRHARFECRASKGDFGPRGQDIIEFFMSPNAGEPLKPLAEIASSGEASRIILALKRALMKVDSIPTLIFDEIDANIGGRLGRVVGDKLKQISGERQVLLITHLPQIASYADRHIKVEKWVEKGKTQVAYKVLAGQERVQELAQMMSGEDETQISKTHAQEMLKSASK
ncbi:MAG: DNA repair protein RecN [Candidatus Omnitrophota bacterium]|nr:DNA repair protein RecN [Candidatus Omnitrophota bacterium]